VLHVPSNFTVSGLLQNAGGDSKSKVTIISLSYTFGGKAGTEKAAQHVAAPDNNRLLATRY
jgi:hypothetical protein